MRIARLLLALPTLVPTGCGAEPAAGLVVANPTDERPGYHDFGRVAWGAVLRHTFLLRNTDREPVEIVNAQGPCKCTRVTGIEYESASGEVVRGDPRARDGMIVVPPGRVVELTLEVDTRKLGRANVDTLEIVRLLTTSPNTPFPTFELHVLAERLFQVSPGTIALDDIPVSAGAAGFVDIVTGRAGSAARIDAIVEPGATVTSRIEELFLGGERVWRVHVEVPGGLERGPFHDRVVVEGSKDETREEIEIAVFARVVDDVVVQPERLVVGVLRAGQPGRVEAELKALVPGMRVGIEQATVAGALGEHAHVEYEAVGPDGVGRSDRWRLVVHLDAGLPPGRIDGELLLSLDDSQYPEVRAQVLGNVR